MSPQESSADEEADVENGIQMRVKTFVFDFILLN